MFICLLHFLETYQNTTGLTECKDEKNVSNFSTHLYIYIFWLSNSIS
jgi:hypothetical protein